METISCRSFTKSRRHPLVIGRIGGWVLPAPVSPTQLMVWLGSFAVLLLTRRVWAHLGAANALVQAVLPLSLAWMVRHLRVEGRSPMQAALGFLTLLAAPRRGVLQGRAFRERGPASLRGTRLFFSERPPRGEWLEASVSLLPIPDLAFESEPVEAGPVAAEGAA